MIGATAKFTDNSKKVLEAASKAAYENLSHAARSIRKDASGSIKQKKDKSKSSEPGQPPVQHRPGFFKRALRYDIDKSKESAVIGFEASKVGQVAATHEHGLTEDGRDYPERPVMQPALERNIERFHRDWRASIG